MKLSPLEKSQITDLLGREATLVELYIFDTMWSEHCSYKSTKSILKKYLPTKGSEVALGIGEDSGIIRFATHNNAQYCIAISHESHNHPSQVLPVEGAATGVGGVVRDVYCMGADVVGVLNSLHFGINKEGKTPIVDEIASRVVFGVSDYANPLGVPVLGGETLYHDSYNDNCLVNVAALGLLKESEIIHSFVPKVAKDQPFDIILLGKSTDATGFGGASFSSATLDAQTQNIGAVQVHDPFLKRVIVEALKELFVRIHARQIPVGIKDLGAGGISCATSEIASAGGFGVTIDLDKVNVAFEGLSPEVIACSETQERFCLAVPTWFTQEVLDLFNVEFELPKLYHNAGAAVIGHVTHDNLYTLLHHSKPVCSIPIGIITTEVAVTRTQTPRPIFREVLPTPVVPFLTLKKICEDHLSARANCSRRYIYRSFDNAVRGDTVIYPGEADAVVVTPIEGCDVGLTVSMDSNLYGHVDPYVSGAYAVAEAVRNVISVGGRPLAVTDCLNYGNPEKGDAFFEFVEGVKGIADACNHLGFIPNEPLPVISGNVSLYNESKNGRAVIPSPVVVVIGRVDNYRDALTMQLVYPDHVLYLISKRYPEFGGTVIGTHLKLDRATAPQVRFDEEKQANTLVHDLIKDKKLSACHDISGGGAWSTLCEMVLGERGLAKVGIDITLPPEEAPVTTLFSENGGYIVALSKANEASVLNTLTESKVYFAKLGLTTTEKEVKVTHTHTHFTIPVTQLAKAYTSKCV